MKTVNPDWIDWSADEHSEYSAQDLIWHFVPDYPIERLVAQNFFLK